MGIKILMLFSFFFKFPTGPQTPPGVKDRGKKDNSSIGRVIVLHTIGKSSSLFYSINTIY